MKLSLAFCWTWVMKVQGNPAWREQERRCCTTGIQFWAQTFIFNAGQWPKQTRTVLTSALIWPFFFFYPPTKEARCHWAASSNVFSCRTDTPFVSMTLIYLSYRGHQTQSLVGGGLLIVCVSGFICSMIKKNPSEQACMQLCVFHSSAENVDRVRAESSAPVPICGCSPWEPMSSIVWIGQCVQTSCCVQGPQVHVKTPFYRLHMSYLYISKTR